MNKFETDIYEIKKDLTVVTSKFNDFKNEMLDFMNNHAEQKIQGEVVVIGLDDKITIKIKEELEEMDSIISYLNSSTQLFEPLDEDTQNLLNKLS